MAPAEEEAGHIGDGPVPVEAAGPPGLGPDLPAEDEATQQLRAQLVNLRNEVLAVRIALQEEAGLGEVPTVGGREPEVLDLTGDDDDAPAAAQVRPRR